MTPRLYGLYRKVTVQGKQRASYVRVSHLAFPKATAIRVFQNALLAAAFGGKEILELRPIRGGMFGQ